MDLEKIEGLLKLLSEHEVREFQFKDEDMELELKLGAEVIAAAPVAMPQHVTHAAPALAPAAAPVAAAPVAAVDEGLVDIESPMVGTMYLAPSPGASNFVSVGTKVAVGQALCIIEAMKLMNEIEADVAGEIVEICVDNAQPVQFGQALFKIRPA